MKVPPKRKGNGCTGCGAVHAHGLNESPSEKEGKYDAYQRILKARISLNESPSEKEGKSFLG